MNVSSREGNMLKFVTKVIPISVLCGSVFFSFSDVLAETAEEKGLAIAIESDVRGQGWTDSSVTLQMLLSNRHGETSTRELRIKSLEVIDAELGDKSLTVFDKPRDVKGTAFLSFTRTSEPDDQWLYLPALKRVKRISSANKSGPFMGSEFSYEDMSSQEVAKYTYKWLRDEACGEISCFVIEQYPVYENSGYKRRIVWIDQENYIPWTIEFYDRKDSLLKTMTFGDYQLYLDKYWRAQKMFVENHLTGKSTTLVFKDYALGSGLDQSEFNRNALSRVR